jgi:hypothetical protein
MKLQYFQQRGSVRRQAITTHCAYTVSEYNEVYTNLIRNTLNWKRGRASLLTDDVKPLILSRIFDGTKDDKRITELGKQLKFLAWFLMQDVLQGQWVEM